MEGGEKEKRSEQMLGNSPKKEFGERAVGEQRFSKRQLLGSERFSGRRDVLTALLSEKKEYSVFEAEKIIEKFLKGKVK